MVYTKLVFVLLLAFLFVGCYEQKRNCLNFKTGTFVFKSNINGVEKQTIFFRNDSIETSNYEGRIDTSSIRWVSDCEYILRDLKNTSSKAIQVKILSTKKDDSYIFEYGYVGDLTNKKRGSAQRIEN